MKTEVIPFLISSQSLGYDNIAIEAISDNLGNTLQKK